MRITVMTPSVRPDMLPIVAKCLRRQTFGDFEWLIGAPSHLEFKIRRAAGSWHKFVCEPEGSLQDYYGLNRCWNALVRASYGQLLVNITDGIWFPPDTLEKFWDHYTANPMACIGGIGHQYDQMEHDKPEHCVWQDPRERHNMTFYQIKPIDLEFCVVSVPKQGLKQAGGFDEAFDKYAAISEKELCMRMEKLGYSFWLDQTIEYRAIKHDRLSKEWDERYQAGCNYFSQCITKINQGQRTILDFLH